MTLYDSSVCRVCGYSLRNIFKANILRYEVDFFECDRCGCVSTEEPYWLEEAYSDAINSEDTGILKRNITLSRIAATIAYFLFDRNGVFLDYAGGYGLLVRLMRDMGFNFYWMDKYADNLFARGFDGGGLSGDNIELLTCFEAFEHFVRPLDEIESMLSLSDSILFSTQLLPQPTPYPNDWWYYGLHHGQHITFYSRKTLEYLSNRFGLYLYTNGRNYHIITKKRFSKAKVRILLEAGHFGLALWPKLKMSSKTFEDHELLSQVNHLHGIK